MDKHLVIGFGEVGGSLYRVLKGECRVFLRDKEDKLGGKYDVLHICYPYSRDFVGITMRYVEQYNPRLVVVHSTVPVGITRQIGDYAVHSPVRGTHPDLEGGLKTFVKYFGGERADEAAGVFRRVGIQVRTFSEPETTELLKILSTTYYAWNVVFAKEVERICDGYSLDFEEVYTIPNRDYNAGYEALGRSNVVRPVLDPVPGRIGGNCLIPNCGLLDDWLTGVIKERNGIYGSG